MTRDLYVAIVITAIILGGAAGLYIKGRTDGASRERERNLIAVAKLNAEHRDRERQWAQRVAEVSTKYQRELRNVQAEKDRALAALRDGTLRLRDPGRRPAVGDAASAGCDGRAGGELSAEASAFLFGLAAEADEVAKQLAAAQEALRACHAR